MKIIVSVSAALLVTAISTHVQAANYALAIGINSNNFTVNDPKGETSSSSQTSLSFISTYNINKEFRLWTSATRYEMELPYGENIIGQQVTNTQFDFILQRAYPFSNFVYGWIGAGFGLGQSDYTNRAKTLSTGYLDPKNVFPNRSETNTTSILNAGILRGISKKVTIGINVNYQQSFNDGIDGTNAIAYVSYQF